MRTPTIFRQKTRFSILFYFSPSPLTRTHLQLDKKLNPRAPLLFHENARINKYFFFSHLNKGDSVNIMQYVGWTKWSWKCETHLVSAAELFSSSRLWFFFLRPPSRNASNFTLFPSSPFLQVKPDIPRMHFQMRMFLAGPPSYIRL